MPDVLDGDKIDRAPTQPVKRGRGRPKGSKTKKRAKCVAAIGGNSELTEQQAALIDRCVLLIEDRAERRLMTLTKRGDPRPQSRAAWVQRQCPDIEAARAAFLAFDPPPGSGIYIPAAAAAYVRLVLHRRQHRVGALGRFLLNGGRFAGQCVSNALQGRHLVVAAEWDRIRAVVEALAVGLSLEPEPERGACADLAAVLADRLNRPTTDAIPKRWRDRINPEVIGLVMCGPLLELPPRAAFPQPQRVSCPRLATA
jgi:hypothetical protein